MKEKTLIFFIDAIRPDQVNPKYMPFTSKFAKKHTFLKLISQLGYSKGIHPSIWQSKHQENHEKFLVYSYDPKKSDFEWIKYLKIFPSPIRRFFISALKAPFYYSKNKKKFPKWYKQKILPIPASIDPKQARFFKKEPSKKETPELFNILRKNKISISSCSDHKHINYGKGIDIKDWKISKNDVDHFYVYETDPIGHFSGPKSKQMKEKLNVIDKKIKELYNEAKSKYNKVNVFVFSDHGMVEVKGNINVKKELKKLKLKPVKDYIVFFDSTMVRFWVKNKKTQKILIQNLSKIPHLNYLDEKLKKKYHVRFKTRKWGDLMFLADPGYRIFPDYFAPVKFNTKGMHGYWPEYEESKGIFITNTFKTKKKEINVVDLMPTMLTAINKKKLIPKNIDGKSII